MRKIKVLFVDDEVEFLAAVSERLSIREIDARTAASGEEALGLIETDPPDVVVLDVMLPGTSGTELLKLIKGEYPRIQVILLTGAEISLRERIEGMRLGAFDYLQKPLSMEDLVEGLRRAAAETGAGFTQ
jgi:DNA-binding response OmpR family regulator